MWEEGRWREEGSGERIRAVEGIEGADRRKRRERERKWVKGVRGREFRKGEQDRKINNNWRELKGMEET